MTEHECPECDVTMVPYEAEYEPGIMVTVHRCHKCKQELLTSESDSKLTHKLLFKRNDEIKRLTEMLAMCEESLKEITNCMNAYEKFGAEGVIAGVITRADIALTKLSEMREGR